MKKWILFFLLIPSAALADRTTRPCNEAATIQFELRDAEESTPGLILEDSASCATGDVKYILDGAASANTSNCFTSEGNGVYSLALVAAETNGARTSIVIDDATATEVWVAKVINIDTYGTSCGTHDTDVNVASVDTDAIDADAIAANAITSSELAADSITASQIATDAITSAEIASGAITSDEIATNAIGAAEIDAAAIGASELATDAIDADAIAASAIGASEIATDAIGAAEIAASAIGASEVGTDAIDSDAVATTAWSELLDTDVEDWASGLGSYIDAIKKYVANKLTISGSNYEVFKDDGSTSFETGTTSATGRNPS